MTTTINDDDDMEIVIVSDTVRQRRSRTPITPSDNNLVMMPDLLPTKKNEENGEAIVGKIVDTVSILESCSKLELQHVEMVNIVDVTSDSDTATSTPIMPRKTSPHIDSIDELTTELRRELDTLSNALASDKKYEKERDILHDSEEVSMMKLRPSLKDLLMEERGSFYNTDKENYEEEPLEFSDDEEIPRFSIEMEMDSDSDLVDRNLDFRLLVAFFKLFYFY